MRITLEPDARVLILCLPGIGDALMATPMLRLLKKRFPAARVDVACMSEGIASVMRRSPDVDTALRVPLYGNGPDLVRALRMTASLRGKRYALSILGYPAYRREYHAFHRVVGAQHRLAHRFPTGYWSELNFLESATVPVDFSVHNVINNLNLLGPLGIDWRADSAAKDFEYTFEVSAEERTEGAAAIRALGFDPSTTVAIHPGSTASAAALRRRWIPERWVAVCRHLVDRHDRRVLIFTGPDEGDLGDVLARMTNRPGRVIEARAGGFGRVMKMLSACRLLISCDNGFGHLAVALGVPVVSLFGVTDYRWSGPYSDRLCRVVRPSRYEPWHRYELKRGVPRHAHDGMREIEVADVLTAVDASCEPPLNLDAGTRARAR
jgi:ADP-heptose:LPS heptosyltransferase